jgi:hypothetical protein
MGKLVEKFQQVRQTSGSGIGFFGRSHVAGSKARAAAIIVSLGANESVAAQAAITAGADALLVTGWTAKSDLSAFTAASGKESGGALLGVWLAEGERGGYGTLKQAQQAGASFAVVGPDASAHMLFEELDHFDRVVTLDVPQDDLGLLLVRAQNLTPAQVALLRVGLTATAIAKMTISDYTRLKLVVESLRFPTLVTLDGAPETHSVPVLARLGFDGLVLPGAGVAADALGAQVTALLEELERTPISHEGSESALLGGLVGTQGAGLSPQREPQREPEREPEREPDHE